MMTKKSESSRFHDKTFNFSPGKRAEFDFVLLFAIIAGTIILLLAIYGAVKAGGTLTKQNEAELAKTLEVITDPLQAGFAEIATSRIDLKKETKITVSCDSYGGFGSNIVTTQTKSSIGEQWSADPLQYTIHNKYLFVDPTPGKTFYVFSQPFTTGFKVADLLFISPRKFCFVMPPRDIAEDIMGLGNTTGIGIRLEDGNNTCSKDAETICFNTYGCNITVIPDCNQARCKSEYDVGTVTNEQGTRISYSKGLMLGAIMTDKDTYECNIKRLTYRASRIADLFSQKIDLMIMRGCDSLIKSDLISFAGLLQNATSRNLEDIYYASNDLDNKRKLDGGCALEW